MSQLPIVHMTLYKHGVGYFRRRGSVAGEAVKLTFRREEMDDLLKSLTVIDLGGGQVRGVDYDTPQSRQERLAGCSVILDDSRSLRDLLMALRGRTVQLLLTDGNTIAGQLLGLDEADEKPLGRSLASVLQTDTETVAVAALSRIEGVELQDDTAAADLRFFLQTALGQETHRSITIRLSPGSHELEVSYIAPAPTWRVSYRLVVDTANNAAPEALLQGWGIFDNRLEEDLTDISLSLTAGMPISFVYDLYTPHTPERPVVKDEDRTAAAPVMFDAMIAEAEPEAVYEMATRTMPTAPAPAFAKRRMSAKAMAQSVESAATGKALGELFQYNVDVPVTVGRGQSAMVPIVSDTLTPRKDLIFNATKMPDHPVATLRFKNSTGLTLERGPVTVLENGEYVGEAVLPFTVDQSEAVISYAVELGVHIEQTQKSEHHLHALSLKDGYMLQQHYETMQTTYRVDNRTPQAKTILLEHNINRSYTIFDTPEPTEKTMTTHRYQVDAAAGNVSKFVVQERHLYSQKERLQNLSYQDLQNYLRGKFLDAPTYARLKDLLDVWNKISRLEKDITRQEKKREKIHKGQEQVQKNMQVLSTSGEEGRLRGRYVQQLVASEEELAQITSAIQRLQTEITQLEEKTQTMIANLGAG
jgi:hypothetical protein